MKNFLKEIGFSEENINHYKSEISPNYLKELKRVTVDILKNNLNDEPILILEDDIKLSPGYIGKPLKIDFKEDTDAFYLGYQRFGIGLYDVKDKMYLLLQYEKLGEDDYRITNTMTAHAIVYKSKKFKERVIKEFEKENPKPNDAILSEILKEYRVYGKNEPMFYQSAQLNNGNYAVEHNTKFKIDSR